MAQSYLSRRLSPRTFGRRAPAFRECGRRVRVIGGRGCTHRHGPTIRPRCGRCPERVVVPPDPVRRLAAMRPAPGGVSVDRINDAAANQHMWNVLARARPDSSCAAAIVSAGRGVPAVPADGPDAGHQPGPGQLAGWSRRRRTRLAAKPGWAGDGRTAAGSRYRPAPRSDYRCAACRRRTSATVPRPPAPGGYPVAEDEQSPGQDQPSGEGPASSSFWSTSTWSRPRGYPFSGG